jgi:prolipoprotein diacylglyceryltransferase
MTESDGTTAAQGTPVSTTASRLFDLRTVLALLFTVYGIVLLIVGLVATDEADIAKAGGWNVNLITGIAMLVLAVFFILWVRLRPVKAPVEEIEGTAGDTAGPPGH